MGATIRSQRPRTFDFGFYIFTTPVDSMLLDDVGFSIIIATYFIPLVRNTAAGAVGICFMHRDFPMILDDVPRGRTIRTRGPWGCSEVFFCHDAVGLRHRIYI